MAQPGLPLGRCDVGLSDRLFELQTDRGRVYSLIEHKSISDGQVSLQVLQYLALTWAQLAKETKGKLPPIMPMLVYHGARPWRAGSAFSGLMDDCGPLGLKALDFDMVVVDIGAIEDERLSSEPTLRAGLMLLKYATRDAGAQRSRLAAVLQALQGAPWLIATGTVYMLATYRHIDRALLLGEVRRVMPEHEEEMMSIAAREWRAEWRAEGRKEGRAEALLHILERRFGPLSGEALDRVKMASAEDVDLWLDRAVEATSLEAVLGQQH